MADGINRIFRIIWSILLSCREKYVIEQLESQKMPAVQRRLCVFCGS